MRTRNRFMRPLLKVSFTLLLVLSALSSLAITAGASGTTGAAFTSVNENYDGTGHCQNGNGNNNCNIYDGKEFVWLNGGPSVAYVGDGTYFFAVLDPGGQSDPNDGAAKNLSDDYDAYTNRTFTVTGSNITSYSGTHIFDSNKIRLLPYADTSNPGGVYIMAICSLAKGYPVAPSDCKYDAFKVKTGTQTGNDDLIVTKDANPAFTRTFTWGIAKSVDKTTVNQSGTSATFNYTVTVTHDNGTDSAWQVTGTISVLNTNLVDFTGVNVTDQINDPNATCVVTNGTNIAVPAGQTVTLSYSCTYSQAPATSAETNTATATWDQTAFSTPSASNSFSIGFTFGVGPTPPNPTLVDNCASISDTYAGSLGVVCSTDPSPKSFNYPRTVTGTAGTCKSFDNTATFTTNSTGTTSSSSQTVTLCVGADLSVSKTANPTFTRTYNWSINKAVDKTKVKQLSGSATFNYTVNVAETGFTDSSWGVTGTITINNPNDWEAISLTGVSDAVDNGGTCTVSGSTTQTIPASGSVTLNYTCSYGSAPSNVNGTNTATATWDKSAAYTPDGSANGQASFNFNTPTTTVNKTITVTDTFNGSTNTLGTLTATDTTPYTTQSFTYARVIAIPQYDCKDYTNTAKIVETNQTSSQKVTVCGPARTGALTMGFWQNKNGQGIISGGTATSGVCNSATWLRQFAPFQDLSATTTCSQVATYVYNLIKAANAAGTSMNPMLKAQMLATALDVYFSDPALGGNKIGAYNGLGSTQKPIGAVTIDLTMICSMSDSSSGSSCSGTLSNVSAAFGGATSMTVLQMLTYAASQSNSGGLVWYAQVKTTQEMAKNAFDAINNEKAFVP